MCKITKEYTLYQVQLEDRGSIYCFEIGTNEYDAVEWAEAFLAERGVFGSFHVGGFDNIGYTEYGGVNKYSRSACGKLMEEWEIG